MAFDAHKNFGIASVATAPSPATSGTTLVVTAGQGARFPTPPFNAVVAPNAVPDPTNAEVVRVTNVATDTLTITRAQEGSGARAVVPGDKIFAAITARTLTDVEGQALAASSLRAYGTSLTSAEGHITIVSDRWVSKLARRLNAIEMNYGGSGTKLLDASNDTGWGLMWKHTGDRRPSTAGSDPLDVRPPAQPLILVHYGINDVGAFGDQAGFQTTFAATIEAVIRMMRAGFAFRDTDARFTYTAGWTANASGTGVGGTSHSRNNTSGSITFTSNSSAFLGGNMTFYALVRSDTSENWRCRAKINGGAYVTTVDTTTGYGITNSRQAIPILVPNVPAGTGQTVTLDFDTVGAGGVYFVGATLESQWPPFVVVLNQPSLATMPSGTQPQLTQARLDGINASLASMPAKWPDGRVRSVDLTSLGTAPGVASDNYADGVHFSPKGHGAVVDLVLAELAKVAPLDAGLGAGPVTDLSGLGIAAGAKPDWSAPPGSQAIEDASVPVVWYPKSIAATDWVALPALNASGHVSQARDDQAILARELSDLARAGGWMPAGAIDETFPRSIMANALTLTSGSLQLSGGIVIPGGRAVTSISVTSSGAATTPTNQWFCLVDRSGNVLTKTSDDTTTAWAANTTKTLNISGGPYTPTNAIEVYVGVVVVAATPPTLWRIFNSAVTFAVGSGGGMGNISTAGLTNPASLGSTVAVPAAQQVFYAYVS